MDNWYNAVYAGENDGGNPFATERAPRTPGLREHLGHGRSITTFQHPTPVISFDAVLASIPGALK